MIAARLEEPKKRRRRFRPRRSSRCRKTPTLSIEQVTGLHDHVRAVPSRRRRRKHRPEPDRRLLAPREQAEEHLQLRARRRARKGMPTWGPQLGETRSRRVVAYVLIDPEDQRPGGKAPQGEKETDRAMANVRLPVLKSETCAAPSSRRAVASDRAGRRARALPPRAHGRLRAPDRPLGRAAVGPRRRRPGGIPRRRRAQVLPLRHDLQRAGHLAALLLPDRGRASASSTSTALAGRVWCGWACPQTVFLEGVYRRIERWIEGPREKRLRRNAGPMTSDARSARSPSTRRSSSRRS